MDLSKLGELRELICGNGDALLGTSLIVLDSVCRLKTLSSVSFVLRSCSMAPSFSKIASDAASKLLRSVRDEGNCVGPTWKGRRHYRSIPRPDLRMSRKLDADYRTWFFGRAVILISQTFSLRQGRDTGKFEAQPRQLGMGLLQMTTANKQPCLPLQKAMATEDKTGYNSVFHDLHISDKLVWRACEGKTI